MSKKETKRGRWTEEEEFHLSNLVNNLLRTGVNSHLSDSSWNKIAKDLGELMGDNIPRGPIAVQARWKKLSEFQLEVKEEPLDDSSLRAVANNNVVAMQVIPDVLNNAVSVLTTLAQNAVVTPEISKAQAQSAVIAPTPSFSGLLPSTVRPKLQLSSGAIVLDFGQFTSHSNDFPVGYKLLRQYPSMYSTSIAQYIFSTDYDEVHSCLLFQIQSSDSNGVIFKNELASEVWTTVQIYIIMTHGLRYWMPKVSAGIEIFGLLDPQVLAVLNSMPRAHAEKSSNVDSPSLPLSSTATSPKPTTGKLSELRTLASRTLIKAPPSIIVTSTSFIAQVPALPPPAPALDRRASYASSTSNSNQYSPVASTSFVPQQALPFPPPLSTALTSTSIPPNPTQQLQLFLQKQPQQNFNNNTSNADNNRRISVESNSGTPDSEGWKLNRRLSTSSAGNSPIVYTSPGMTGVKIEAAESITRIQPKRIATSEVSKTAYEELRSSDIEADDND